MQIKNWYELKIVVGDDLHLSTLRVQQPLPRLDRLSALFEFILTYLGLGAGRLAETLDLEFANCQWSVGRLYYFAASRKAGSLRARQGKMNEHKLPASFGRAFLLFQRLVHIHGREGQKLFPAFENRDYEMMHATRDIFDLDIPIDPTVSRQFITSLLNILFPGGTEMHGIFVSAPCISTQSHHTAATAIKKYSTNYVGRDTSLYEYFHSNIGDPTLIGIEETTLNSPVSYEEIVETLELVFGKGATFRSDSQKQALFASCNSATRHRMFLQPCGDGKSFNILAPLLMEYVRGSKLASYILIAPHVSLVGHQQAQLQEQLDVVKKDHFLVKGFTGGDLLNGLPMDLYHAKHLPNIIILSIDAFASLVKNKQHISSWVSESKLKGILVDEVQLLASEADFRPVYSTLKNATGFGVPVTIMSGSITKSLGLYFAEYMGMIASQDMLVSAGIALSDEEGNIETVHGLDNVIRSDFSFEVVVVIDSELVQRICDYTKKQKEVCDVHIICTTVTTCNDIHTKLKESGVNCCVISGNSTANDKMQEIQKWRDGVVSVLISTTAALVGVENKNCCQIIVTGMLYSISNLVQAIGRLRIEQCGPDTIVTQYIGEKECGEKEQHVQDSKQKLKNLQNMFGEFDNAELAKEAEEILTINGYRMWLETSGCMIANLERVLSRGQRLRKSCGRCTNCKAFSEI